MSTETYEERIRRARTNMSKSFARLADFLLDDYIEAAFMTASELAQRLDLDAATVVRFSQRLGYEGFPELQREVRQRVVRDLFLKKPSREYEETASGIALQALDELMAALERTRLSLDTDALEKLVGCIGEARRIIILPEGPAQPSAYSLVLFLEQGAFPVYIARAGVLDLARMVHTATASDLILAMEVVGQSPMIARALQEAQSKHIPTAAILASASLVSGRFADIVLAAQAVNSIGVGIVAIEAIVYALARALFWRYADRFAGAEQAIAQLSDRIQKPLD